MNFHHVLKSDPAVTSDPAATSHSIPSSPASLSTKRHWATTWATVLCLLLFGSTAARAGEFDCADPADLPPKTTDLVVTQDTDLSELEPGQTLTYTVQIHNCGPIAATNVGVNGLVTRYVRVINVEQVSGPTFTTLIVPQYFVLNTDYSNWFGQISSMAVGETAVFEITVAHAFI